MVNVILEKEEIEKKLKRIAGEIADRNTGLKDICIIGICLLYTSRCG